MGPAGAGVPMGPFGGRVPMGVGGRGMPMGMRGRGMPMGVGGRGHPPIGVGGLPMMGRGGLPGGAMMGVGAGPMGTGMGGGVPVGMPPGGPRGDPRGINSARKDFVIATRRGDFEKVRRILDAGLVSLLEVGPTALHTAAACGNQGVVAELLRRGVDVNVEVSGATALDAAVQAKHGPCAEFLRAQGGRPGDGRGARDSRKRKADDKDAPREAKQPRRGETPKRSGPQQRLDACRRACAGGDAKALRDLVLPPPASATGEEGAAGEGSAECEARAKRDAQTEGDAPAEGEAPAKGDAPAEGDAPAKGDDRAREREKEREKEREALLKEIAAMDGRARTAEHPLFLACSHGRSECVAVLLEAGVDPNSQAREGEGAGGELLTAVAFTRLLAPRAPGRDEVLRALASFGGHSGVAGLEGAALRSRLLLATERDDAETVGECLAAGADATGGEAARESAAQSPGHLAALKGRDQALAALLGDPAGDLVPWLSSKLPATVPGFAGTLQCSALDLALLGGRTGACRALRDRGVAVGGEVDTWVFEDGKARGAVDELFEAVASEDPQRVREALTATEGGRSDAARWLLQRALACYDHEAAVRRALMVLRALQETRGEPAGGGGGADAAGADDPAEGDDAAGESPEAEAPGEGADGGAEEEEEEDAARRAELKTARAARHRELDQKLEAAARRRGRGGATGGAVDLSECLLPPSLADLGLPDGDPWGSYPESVLSVHPAKSAGWLEHVLAELGASGLVDTGLPLLRDGGVPPPAEGAPARLPAFALLSRVARAAASFGPEFTALGAVTEAWAGACGEGADFLGVDLPRSVLAELRAIGQGTRRDTGLEGYRNLVSKCAEAGRGDLAVAMARRLDRGADGVVRAPAGAGGGRRDRSTELLLRDAVAIQAGHAVLAACLREDYPTADALLAAGLRPHLRAVQYLCVRRQGFPRGFLSKLALHVAQPLLARAAARTVLFFCRLGRWSSSHSPKDRRPMVVGGRYIPLGFDPRVDRAGQVVGVQPSRGIQRKDGGLSQRAELARLLCAQGTRADGVRVPGVAFPDEDSRGTAGDCLENLLTSTGAALPGHGAMCRALWGMGAAVTMSQADFFECVVLNTAVGTVVDHYDSALVRSMGLAPRGKLARQYPEGAPARRLEHMHLPPSKAVLGVLEGILGADEAITRAVAAVAVLSGARFRARAVEGAQGPGEDAEGARVLELLGSLDARLRGRSLWVPGANADKDRGEGPGEVAGVAGAGGEKGVAGEGGGTPQSKYHSVSVLDEAATFRSLVDGIVAAGLVSVKERIPVPAPTAMACVGGDERIPKLHRRSGFKKWAHIDMV